MEKIEEQINVIRKYLQRSLDQNLPYSYEVILIDNDGRTELVGRTSGLESFDSDMKEAVESSQRIGGKLEIKVYSGKSNNARVKNTYYVSIANSLEKREEPSIRDMIREELSVINPKNKSIDGLGSLDSLVSAITGQSDGKDGIAGLMGLASTLATQNSNVAINQTQHQLEIFKLESKHNTLKEKYVSLVKRYNVLVAQSKESKLLTAEQAKSIKELEEQLTSYAPNELVRRMATGVLSTIGSNLLGNERVAKAIGVTENELKGALGLLDSDNEKSAPITESKPVEITPVAISPVSKLQNLSPEEKAKTEILNDISNALSECSLSVIQQVHHILVVSMSSNTVLDNVEEMITRLEKVSNDKNNVSGVSSPSLEHEIVVDENDVQKAD